MYIQSGFKVRDDVTITFFPLIKYQLQFIIYFL